MIQWVGSAQRLWAMAADGACLGHIRPSGEGWDVFVPSAAGSVARLRGCDDAEAAARTLCARWRVPYTPLPEGLARPLGTSDLAAARAAYLAWADFCGGENPEEPDPLMLGVALREVDRLTAELTEARETLQAHSEEFARISEEVERSTRTRAVGSASSKVRRLSEFLLDAMKRNMLAAQREQRQIGDAAVEAAREEGRRAGLEEAASLCAPRDHGGTEPGMFIKANALADEIRALGAKPAQDAP